MSRARWFTSLLAALLVVRRRCAAAELAQAECHRAICIAEEGAEEGEREGVVAGGAEPAGSQEGQAAGAVAGEVVEGAMRPTEGGAVAGESRRAHGQWKRVCA